MPTDAYTGEIQPYAGSYPPRGWAFCEGQVLEISQNTALFAILGTRYGGDGRATFGLPDLRGRVPVGASTTPGPGLTPRSLGQLGGEETVTLSQLEMAGHSHAVLALVACTIAASTEKGEAAEPSAGDVVAASYNAAFDANANWYIGSSTSLVELEGASSDVTSCTIGATGDGRSHFNVQPFQAVNYIICLDGVFPPRN
ncbi:MAG: phage tail protein [Myxococcales bacterium FL481]|nr:MAG: phage tail protein [Myxococcales bacterium FL481]